MYVKSFFICIWLCSTPGMSPSAHLLEFVLDFHKRKPHSLQGRPAVCSTVVLLEVVVGLKTRGSAGEGLTAEWRAAQVEGDQESCRDGHGGRLGLLHFCHDWGLRTLLAE